MRSQNLLINGKGEGWLGLEWSLSRSSWAEGSELGQRRTRGVAGLGRQLGLRRKVDWEQDVGRAWGRQGVGTGFGGHEEVDRYRALVDTEL